MAKYKVDITGINTSNLKALSYEENMILFEKMKTGDKFARDDLINGNLKLVLSIIKRFNQRGENLDDLFQVGCVGLVKAIDNFDLSYGVKLSTYAVPMILGEVKRYLRDNNSIRVSRSVKDLAYNILKTKDLLTIKYGREVTLDEIAKELEIDEVELANALDAMRTPISIYEPIYNDGGDTIYLCDQIACSNSNTSNLDIDWAVNNAINDLNPREKQIIEDRYITGKTQMEIASELGLSQAQISRLEKDAIKTLKKVLK